MNVNLCILSIYLSFVDIDPKLGLIPKSEYWIKYLFVIYYKKICYNSFFILAILSSNSALIVSLFWR